MRSPLLLALLSTGCLNRPVDPPAPPAAARVLPLDREAAAALDGRDTFALAGRPDERFVSVLETAHVAAAVRADGALVDLTGSTTLARDVLPELRASADGRVVAFAVRTADAVADVTVLSGGRVVRLTEGLPAVVLAVSPDGTEVAFLAATGGLPAVWTVAVAGGAPRQLTNVGVVRDPARGRPPVGFVSPPERAAGVSWVDGEITYGAAGGRVRIDAASGTVVETP